MRTNWTFHTAGELVFGAGAVHRLGELARRQRIERALLVTDQQLVALGLAEQAIASLRSANVRVDVFDGGCPEPSLEVVARCIDRARAAAPQGVVGLGGGSNIDLAKIAAVLLAHGGVPGDYVGDDRVPGPVLPILAIPTTSGTGSEVSAATVLTDQANQIKVGVLSNYLRPAVALVDPHLTLTCPAKVTAESGIDALTHAIEAYTAIDYFRFPLPAGEQSIYQGRYPLCDGLAEQAIALIGAHLVTAVRSPGDTQAREAMSLAATLAGMAFSNAGVAAVHALEYPIGGATHCSHGAGNGLLLPFVMEFNLPERQRELARIAELLGADIAGLSQSQAARRAIEHVHELKAAIGIPARLADLGVRAEQLRGFAEKSWGIQRIMRVNPRSATVDDLERILQSAL